jgi:hypothetical protein
MKGLWDEGDNDFLATAGIEEVKTGVEATIVIAIDVSQALAALFEMIAFFAALVPEAPEEIMRWEDDGGATIVG